MGLDPAFPPIEMVGSNPVRLWGLTTDERARRIAHAAAPHDAPRVLTDADALPVADAGPLLLADAGYVWDPAWLRHVAARPGAVLTLAGRPVLGHARSADEARGLREAMRQHRAPAPECEIIAFEDGPTLENRQLRKRETPFVLPLHAATVRAAERASYFGAYKGVTDLLTRFLWPEWALALTRLAARAGISPNQVTAVGAAFCVAATIFFAQGRYWAGMASGLAFMVLDTVDGKLARCTITSSKLGNLFDHGIDLVHPPFWWWFWATGLAAAGLAYDEATFWLVQGAIQGGYGVQRLIEAAFMRTNGMMHIHVWQRFDSWFRLITARRNPNMVILFAGTLAGRPDLGLIAVAWWTVLCCAVHAVRLAQAMASKARGRPVRSWLSAG